MHKKNYLKKFMFYNIPLLLVYLVLYGAYSYLGVYFSELLGDSIDIAASDMSTFKGFAVLLVTVTCAMMVSYLLYAFVKNIYKKKVYNLVRKKLFEHIFKKDVANFAKVSKDVYLSSLVNDSTLLEKNYIDPTFSMFEDCCTLLIAMIALLYMNVGSAIFVLAISFLPVFIPVLFMNKLQTKMGQYAQANQDFLQTVNDCMAGFETYKNYNAVDSINEYFVDENKKNIKAKKESDTYMDLVMSVLSVSSNLMLIGILVFGMFMALSGKLTVGEVFAIMFISGSVVSPIATISQNLPNILATKEVVNKYNDLFDSENVSNHRSASIEKGISLRNLRLTLSEREILHGINLDIQSGRKYAFVGGSGSGKSTILKSMLGFFDSYEGSILFDGVELGELNKSSVFSKLTYISQNSVLFSGTLRDNITLFNDKYSDEDIYRVIEIAQLKSLVDAMDYGIDTLIEEGGKNFSGGEKQRIAFARALLRGNTTYFMDEATSALDYANYLTIENMLLAIPNATLVTVTHRIDENIISKYDCIFAIKEGCVEEVGTYEELLSANAYFADLVNSQNLSADAN